MDIFLILFLFLSLFLIWSHFNNFGTATWHLSSDPPAADIISNDFYYKVSYIPFVLPFFFFFFPLLLVQLGPLFYLPRRLDAFFTLPGLASVKGESIVPATVTFYCI